MKLYSLILALCGIMAVALLGGCSDNGSKHPAPVGFTSATLTMKWPSRTRLTPMAAESIKLDLTTPSGYNQTQTVNRPSGGDNSTITFSNVPVGTVTVTATAYPEADAQGVAQATGTKTASGVVGVPLRIVLTMGSTIDHMTIFPSNTLDPDDPNNPDDPNAIGDFNQPYVINGLVILGKGKTVQFAATPYNNSGEVVLVHPGNITWTCQDTSVATIDRNTGMLYARFSGKTMITATESESHKVVAAQLIVMPQNNYEFYAHWGEYGVDPIEFDNPEALAVDQAENVFIADTDNNRIQCVTTDGVSVASWGSLGTGDGEFTAPRGVAVDSDGNVYVTDDTNRVQKFSNDGVFLKSWGGSGSGDGMLNMPTGIAISQSNQVYVIDSGNARVQWFGPDGDYRGQWEIPAAVGEVATGIAVDNDDNVYLADYNQYTVDANSGFSDFYRVRKYTAFGVYQTEWKTVVAIEQPQEPRVVVGHPVAIATDSRNNVYLVDTITCRIQKYDQYGLLLGLWSKYGYAHGYTLGAHGIAVSKATNYIYVSDAVQNTIMIFHPTPQ